MRHLIIALLVLFTAAPALARDIKHTAAGVQFSVPDTWKTESEGPLVQITAPDEKSYIMFLGMADSEFEQKIDGLAKVLEELKITDFEASEPEETTHKGMPLMTMDGKAKFEGQPIELGLVFMVPPGSGKALMVFGVTATRDNDKAVEKILGSISPL